MVNVQQSQEKKKRLKKNSYFYYADEICACPLSLIDI